MIKVFCEEDTGAVFFLNLGAWKETRSSALSVFHKHTSFETSHGIHASFLYFFPRMCGDKILFLDESRKKKKKKKKHGTCLDGVGQENECRFCSLKLWSDDRRRDKMKRLTRGFPFALRVRRSLGRVWQSLGY